MPFGQRLQEVRRKNGMTQEEFAAQLKVSRQAVSKWESCRGYPEIEKIIFICNRYGVTMNELFCEEVPLPGREARAPEHPERRTLKTALSSFFTNLSPENKWVGAGSLLCVTLLLLLCMALPCAVTAEQADARRVVYLTFDDGPKKDTPELLDALEALDVPATFFLVGLGVRAFPEYARQIVQAGHAVGCHTMGHAAGAIKKDEDFVLRDIGRFNKMMSEEIEPGFSTDLFRFPGGSSSYKARIKAKVRDAGYAWFDWNTMTGDAQYSFSSDREMLEYTLGQAHGKDVVILLMHEGKTRTRRILPELVAYFRENGYEFRRLSTGEEDREILSHCGAHFMLPDAEQGGH